MSFAECNGKLYATVAWEIYERQDGITPSWTKVFTWGQGLPLTGSGGLRGLTSIADPSGGGQVLLVAAEGGQGRLLRIAPGDHYSVAADLNVLTYASRELHTPVRALIVAYNDMTPYPQAPQPGVSPGSLLIGGYDAKTPQSPDGLGPAPQGSRCLRAHPGPPRGLPLSGSSRPGHHPHARAGSHPHHHLVIVPVRPAGDHLRWRIRRRTTHPAQLCLALLRHPQCHLIS